MTSSTITIEVGLDQDRVPENIRWNASDAGVEKQRQAKAFLLSLWDGADKTALRIDLWTKDMMVDEMEDFFYQTLMTMADTYERATPHGELTGDIRNFARDLFSKSRARQLKENKLV